MGPRENGFLPSCTGSLHSLSEPVEEVAVAVEHGFASITIKLVDADSLEIVMESVVAYLFATDGLLVRPALSANRLVEISRSTWIASLAAVQIKGVMLEDVSKAKHVVMYGIECGTFEAAVLGRVLLKRGGVESRLL